MRHPALATGSDTGAVRNVVRSPRTGSFSRGLRLVELVGRGGTSEVWRVVGDGGREAALKTPSAASRHHAGAAVLIQREYEVLRAVAGRHIVEAYELVEHDAAPALVMEYLPHGDLVPLVGARPEHWLPAFRAAVTALIEVHRRGFAHGDVKARNVLFAADGSARLIDFTSARPLESRAAVSTPAYGLPARLQAAGPDGDCFALAVLLYELSTGSLPYGAAGPADVAEIPAVAPSDPRAAPLLAGAVGALRAAGRVESPAYFLDVIESAYDVAG